MAVELGNVILLLKPRSYISGALIKTPGSESDILFIILLF